MALKSREVKKENIDFASVGPNQLEPGAVGKFQISPGEINISHFDNETKKMLLSNSFVSLALSNSSNPGSENPFVTREEVFSFTSHWKSPVQKLEDLPTKDSGLNKEGDSRLVISERIIYFWLNGQWLGEKENKTLSDLTTVVVEKNNSIEIVTKDFKLGINDFIDIIHGSDIEYNRIVQVKEKVSGTDSFSDIIPFTNENNYTKTSLYTITNSVVAISSKQILTGSKNLIWNPGIVGLGIEDENKIDYRVESIIVQDNDEIPNAVDLETNLLSDYTGTVYFSNASITGNDTSLIRQKNVTDFTILSDTSISSESAKNVKMLGAEISGTSAILSIREDDQIKYSFKNSGSEDWIEYVVKYKIGSEDFPIIAEKFHAIHIGTIQSAAIPIDTILTTLSGDLLFNDMYAVVYIEKGTKKPYFAAWSHNYGTPVFQTRVALDPVNESWDSFSYEDIYIDIKETKSTSSSWGTVASSAKTFETKYIISIVGSILENDGTTDRIGFWLNDNASHNLIGGWTQSTVNPIKSPVGTFGENPKVIITTPNFSSMAAITDNQIDSQRYRIWVFYRDSSISGIKSIAIKTPTNSSFTDGFNFISNIRSGVYPGDNPINILSPGDEFVIPSFGLSGETILLFVDAQVPFKFTCSDNKDYDITEWESDLEPGVLYGDNVNNLVRRGGIAVASSNSSNDFEICIQYKKDTFTDTDWSLVQKTNQFGRKLQLKSERKFSRHFDNATLESGKVNSDNLHLFYIKNSDPGNINTLSVPSHIHNTLGTVIDENQLSVTTNSFEHRMRNFSKPLEYLDFAGINDFSFGFNDIGGIEFSAFNDNSDIDIRGLYFAEQNSQCKFSIWDSSLGKVNPGPGPRSGFTHFHYGGFAYIQGGYGVTGELDSSMWRLNVASNIWRIVSTENAPPRIFHSSDVITNIAYKGISPDQTPFVSTVKYYPPTCNEDPTDIVTNGTQITSSTIGVWIKLRDFGLKCVKDSRAEFNLSITGQTADFNVGDIIVGATSSAQGEVLEAALLSNAESTVFVGPINSNSTFVAGENLDVSSSTIAIAGAGNPVASVNRWHTSFIISDSNEPNNAIQQKIGFCNIDPLTNMTKTTEGYRDSIINFELSNMTSGASGVITRVSYPEFTGSNPCNDVNAAVFLEISNFYGGSRLTFLEGDNIIISFPNKPPNDQVVMYGGGGFNNTRTNGYPDDLSNSVSTPPDAVALGGTGNISDDQSFSDARTIFVSNLNNSDNAVYSFVFAPIPPGGSNFAPVPSVSGSLIITNYSRDLIGGISKFPNFILIDRSNAYRFKMKYEQDPTDVGRPFTFLGRWSQLNPIKSNSGEPLEGTTGWKSAKLNHYGGRKPAPQGHSINSYKESSSTIYFGGFIKSDFKNQYLNSTLIINSYDVNLGWSLISPVDEFIPKARSGNGIMVVNRNVENPDIDNESFIIYNEQNDLDNEIWITGGNNEPIESLNFKQTKSLDDTWNGRFQYEKRSFSLGTLSSDINFIEGRIPTESFVDIKLNSGFNGYMVPNGIRTSDNTVNSNKEYRSLISINYDNLQGGQSFTVDDIVNGFTSGARGIIIGVTILTSTTGTILLSRRGGAPGTNFLDNEQLRVGGVYHADVNGIPFNTKPEINKNDRYNKLSINDPTDIDFITYGPNDIFGSPDWITEVTYDAINSSYNPERDNNITIDGTYFPDVSPVVGERRWTVLSKLTITIQSGPGSGNHIVYVGVYNNGINSYVEYFIPNSSLIAFDLAFIEFSGGLYNEDITIDSGKSWIDVGKGTLRIQIRNTTGQFFDTNNLPKITAIDNIKFSEITGIKWRDMTTPIGIKPFKSTWGGLISDHKTTNNIVYFGGRTHAKRSVSDVFTWNSPSTFIQNEKSIIYQFSEINGSDNNKWISLKHENIVRSGSIPSIGETLDYSVTSGTRYASWGIAKIITNQLTISTGTNADFQRKVAYVGFTITPNDQDSVNLDNHPGLGVITSESLTDNIEFTGLINFKEGKISINPSPTGGGDLVNTDLFQIVDINYHTLDGPINSKIKKDINNNFSRIIGDKVGGEHSSRIHSWITTRKNINIDASSISLVKDDRALSLTFDTATVGNVSRVQISDILTLEQRYIANTNFNTPAWFIQEIRDFGKTTNSSFTSMADFFAANTVRMAGRIRIRNVRLSSSDPDIRGYQYFRLNNDGSTIVFTNNTQMSIEKNGDIVDPNYDITNDSIFAAAGAPIDTTGASGILSGSYTYKITFVNIFGETEGGTVSAGVVPSSQQVNLSSIPIGPAGTIARKVYRTIAGPGPIHKLVTTISDNTTTTFSDNIADSALGVDVPTFNSSGVYDIPYVSSVTPTTTPNVNIDIQLAAAGTNSGTLGTVGSEKFVINIDMIYIDNTIGVMTKPIEINDFTNYMKWQDTNIKVMFSFDEGLTWKKYDFNSDFWIAVDPQDQSQGMDITTLPNIISFPWSGWNNSVRSGERDIPNPYRGFIEGETESIRILIGVNTFESSYAPSINEMKMNFLAGSFWEPRNFARTTSGNQTPTTSNLNFIHVKMISPTTTRIFNLDPTSNGIKTFKTSVMLKRNA